MSFTIAPTAFSPAINASRISRRCTSATALKTSDVVEALATKYYMPLSTCVKPFETAAGPCATRVISSRVRDSVAALSAHTPMSTSGTDCSPVCAPVLAHRVDGRAHFVFAVAHVSSCSARAEITTRAGPEPLPGRASTEAPQPRGRPSHLQRRPTGRCLLRCQNGVAGGPAGGSCSTEPAHGVCVRRW